MTQRLVITADQHAPYQDETAHAILLEFLAWFKPDAFVVAGDLLDCYQLSHFDRDPGRREHFRDELQQAGLLLDDYAKALPKRCARWFIGGNHEDRIRRYLWGRAPELADLDELDIPQLLDLERKHWQWIPYYDPVSACGAPGLQLYGLLIMHGIFARQAAGYTAKAHFERFHVSGVCGHCHRQGSFQRRAWGGQWIFKEAGCMCKLEPPYMASPDWQQGFLYAYVSDEHPDNPAPRFELREAIIHNAKLSVEGRIFKG